MRRCVGFLLSILPIVLHAQNTITFTAKDILTSAPVSLDSIHVLHEASLRDTTLIGVTEFRIGTPTSVPGISPGAVPFELSVPSPTLFDAKTSFHVRQTAHSIVDIGVYSVLGKRVARWSGHLTPGTAFFELDGTPLAAGIYFIVASSPSQVIHRKALKLTGSGAGTAALSMLTMTPAGMVPNAKTMLDTWTFIGYAKGYLPDTLLSVEAEAGKEYGFLMTSEPAGMKLHTGRLHHVLTAQVPVSGATVSVTKPGSPVDGFSITIPDKAHDAERQYTISYAEILNHRLGPDVRMITPLIQVSNGGGYADGLLELRIQAQIPSSEFAMAFLYNERTGEIEGLPLLEETSSGLTAVTRHFATSKLLQAGFGKRSAGDWADAVGNLFVASVKNSFLGGQNIITTGYAPGRDDWEFPNYGSYIAPAGHCAGQSVTAMWYYYEKRLQNEPPLYHRYDVYNKHQDTLWADNPRGYKFASVVQQDMRWDGWLYYQLMKLEDSTLHSFAFKATIMSMVMTGEPQCIGLTNSTGGGHAVVCYGIDVSRQKLLIADPNTPGDEQSIAYSNGYFGPYLTKQNANDPAAQPYPYVGYIAKTAIIDWNRIASRWREFEAKTIGSIEPNTFPQINYIKPEGDPFPAVYDIHADTLKGKFHEAPQNVESGYIVWNDKLERCDVPGGFALLPGNHVYGATVYGKINNKWRFLDFTWLQVNSIRPVITRISGGYDWGEEITIEGRGFGSDRDKGIVRIDTIPMPDVRAWSDTAIRVAIPNEVNPGYVSVRVEKATSNQKWWSVNVPPAIYSITPGHGYWRDTITIRGRSLKKISKVRFNGWLSLDAYEPIPPVWSDSVITARVPNNCVTGPITLIPFGNKPEVVSEKIFTQDSLEITSIDPVSGPKNTVINIYGKRFGQKFWQGAEVLLGGQPAGQILNWEEDRIAIYGTQSGRIDITLCGKTVEGPVFTMTP